ncbi:unnamed protein product [Blepharisma stoltei]|uniref:Uncharacterized protein n=1 Tax=Blepharisma stoltei TaxID=1481888 RepID=A0AAU9JA28_9CILI|nr:unnamed protein product [Blepharisma stoltei]
MISSGVPRFDLKPQELGSRPRLISQESYDCGMNFNDNSDFEPSSPSEQKTEESLPLICLPKLEISHGVLEAKDSIVTSHCVYEHERLGFTPLSHTICSDGGNSVSEDDFSFGMDMDLETNYNPFQEPTEIISEDIKAAIYKRYCDMANNVKLFNFRGEKISLYEQLSELQTRMKGFRETRLKLR